MTAIMNDRARNEETKRANKAQEKLGAESQSTREKELQERTRSNKAAEKLERSKQKETQRANRAGENLRMKQYELAKVQGIAQSVGSALSGIGSGAILAFNDWLWYVKNANVAESILSLPTADPLGLKYPVTNYSTMQEGYLLGGPSVLSMRVAPTIGGCDSISSPVMKAMQQLWIRVNEKNGRNSSYDAVTLGMYQIGVASNIGLLSWLMKIYSILKFYTAMDRAIPEALLLDLGISSTIRDHVYELHNLIDEFQNFLRTYKLVPDFYLAHRWHFVFGTILADELPGNRVQLYQYTPAFFWKLSVSGTTTSMDKIMIADQELAIEDLTDIVRDIEASFFSYQDVKIMNSDLESFYGAASVSDFLGSENFPFNYPIRFATEKWALEQFHNAEIGLEPDYDQFSITEVVTESANYIRSTGPWSNAYVATHFVSTADRSTELTPAMLVEATRLKPIGEFNDKGLPVLAPGVSEYPVSMRVYALGDKNGGSQNTVQTLELLPNAWAISLEEGETNNGTTYVGGRERKFIYTLYAQASFKYCPYFVSGVKSADGGVFAAFHNWDNYAEVPTETLLRANYRIALRLLGCGDNS